MEKEEKQIIKEKFNRISAIYNMSIKDWANVFGIEEISFKTTSARWDRKKLVVKLFELFKPELK